MTIYAPQSTDPHAPLWAVTGSHRAGALDTLAAAIDAHWPHRDHASDGFLGDARHVAEGSASDHNPWLAHTVRAGDFDADGIPADWLAEQLLAAGAAGDRRLTGGGYVIYNRRITAPDFTGWHAYTGGDPHTSHLHVSLTRDPAGFEDRGAWAFLDTAHPQPPHPAIPAPTAQHPDLRGDGDGLRGELGDQGPRVAELQHDLNTYAPAYSHLAEDGIYGPQTAHVLDQYAERNAHEADTPPADRAGLHDADGANIGPRLARALHHDGLI